MANPSIAIIRFPGTNREREAFKTAKEAGFTPFYFRWNDDFAKLKEASAYVLPGGFSYEDRSRSGIMCALDPVMKVVREEASKGKPVLGICNGAQMLIESGMVPGGVKNMEPLMCIARNVREKDGKILGTGFINTWVNLKVCVPNKRSAFTYDIEDQDLKITCPIAHGEGRYTTLDKDLVKKLQENNQIVLRYCDDDREVIDEYPTNPNGATDNIAGIINPEGNIMAAMPHFEHFAEIGRPIFQSMLKYVLDGNSLKNLDGSDEEIVKEKTDEEISNFEADKSKVEFFVRLIITDNEAESVTSVLRNIGHDVTIGRRLHFELDIDNKEDLFTELKSLIKSGELLNTNKELCDVRVDDKYYHFSMTEGFVEIEKPEFKNGFLVREIDDYIGKAKNQTLNKRLGFTDISEVKRGIIWLVDGADEEVKKVVDTKIFHNPNAQVIFNYN